MVRIRLLFLCILLPLLFHACSKPDKNPPPGSCVYDPTPVMIDPPDYLPPLESPPDNPLTEEGIRLGRKLFYEPLLSADTTLSCAGCHNQTYAFSDQGKRYSTGIDGIAGTRNAMALFNLAYASSFFWDGRAATLEEQVIEPVPNPIEMHQEWPEAIKKLQNHPEYPCLFYAAFGDSIINRDNAAKAMAQFLRTLISGNSRYDKYLRGELFGTGNEFTESEERGLQIFMNEFGNPEGGGDCFHCHGGILFQNVDPSLQFRNNGLQEAATLNDFADKGRGAVTGNPQDNGKFKVPSLRNIALTAPYMHDGRFATLEEVIDFYSEGLKRSPNVDPLMKGAQAGGVHLTPQQKQDLLNFLYTLTDEAFVTNPEYASPH
ncbi:MAG: cytochrome-c peroxidase [Chitinophagales bacterium]|nr:MAG: cytochrome-c peroxidase [Chitinophagales bacterium]